VCMTLCAVLWFVSAVVLMSYIVILHKSAVDV